MTLVDVVNGFGYCVLGVMLAALVCAACSSVGAGVRAVRGAAASPELAERALEERIRALDRELDDAGVETPGTVPRVEARVAWPGFLEWTERSAENAIVPLRDGKPWPRPPRTPRAAMAGDELGRDRGFDPVSGVRVAFDVDQVTASVQPAYGVTTYASEPLWVSAAPWGPEPPFGGLPTLSGVLPGTPATGVAVRPAADVPRDSAPRPGGLPPAVRDERADARAEWNREVNEAYERLIEDNRRLLYEAQAQG